MKKDQTFKGKNGSFNYIDWGGNGPLAHFSHATGLCANSYTPFVNRITHRLKVFGMDDRGHGRTTAPADKRKLHNWEVFIDDFRYIPNQGHVQDMEKGLSKSIY